MSLLIKLVEKYNRLRQEAAELLTKYHAALDAEKADEATSLKEQYERGFAAASAAKDQLDEARKLDDLGDVQIVRRDNSFGGEPAPNGVQQSAARDLTPPPAEALQRRQSLLEDMMMGFQPTERETVDACRVYPVERLWPSVMLNRASPGEFPLEATELKAWREYEQVAQRAVTDSFNLTTGTGGDFIPTFLEPRIRSLLQATVLPLAVDGLVTVFQQAGIEARQELPTAANIAKWTVTAPSTDGTPETGASGKPSLNTNKYTKHINVPSEILLGSYVNFESWVIRSVAEAWGLTLNADRTLGNGTLKITGAFTGAVGTTHYELATSGAIVEADIVGMIAKLGEGYHFRPNTRIMMRRSTELYLAGRRSTQGNRLFDVTPNGAQIILPGGIPYVTNPDMQALGTNDNKVMGVGDFSQYAVLYGGRMRSAMSHVVASDQWEMGWYYSTDGKPIFTDAFRFAYDK